MLVSKYLKRILLLLLSKLILKFFQRLRIFSYKVLSDNKNVIGNPTIIQPLLLKGTGEIEFKNEVQVGYNPSPFLYNGYCHIESRNKGSKISFGKNTFINNNIILICDKTKISIGENVLIGTNVEIYDSDFHGIHPNKRNSPDYNCAPVSIGNNVFIGSNVKIMKGVTIGENSVVANSSIVVRDVPENVVVGGNPAKVIKSVLE